MVGTGALPLRTTPPPPPCSGVAPHTLGMAGSDSLKRLGGGRWETRDGRFAIEPQSGTWAVVDTSETNELGLPLVLGPFKSLTAAKEAIEAAREGGPRASPLAERIRSAASMPPAGATTDGAGLPASRRQKPRPPAKPEPPPEPRWIRDLDPADRRRARELVERLESAGVEDAEAAARAEIARDQPAVARIALERRLRRAIAANDDPRKAVEAALAIILDGRDRELDVRWRLVDDGGRRIDEISVRD